MILYQILADLIPSFIYYHAGTSIRAIHDEINNKIEETKREVILIVFCLSYGQNIIVSANWLKERIDSLDGCYSSISVSSSSWFASSHTICWLILHATATQLISFFVMITYIDRLINSVFLMSELQESRVRLAAKMSVHHNTYWVDMNDESRRVFSDFKLGSIGIFTDGSF